MVILTKKEERIQFLSLKFHLLLNSKASSRSTACYLLDNLRSKGSRIRWCHFVWFLQRQQIICVFLGISWVASDSIRKNDQRNLPSNDDKYITKYDPNLEIMLISDLFLANLKSARWSLRWRISEKLGRRKFWNGLWCDIWWGEKWSICL